MPNDMITEAYAVNTIEQVMAEADFDAFDYDDDADIEDCDDVVFQ